MQEPISTERELKKKANVIRQHIIGMLFLAGSGHPGGSLSAADLLAVLYYYKLRHDPENPKMKDRDRFVLSKGHAAPALYAVLGEMGYFDKKEFRYLRKIGALLQGHPHITTPGIEISTGSLGQGLSIACGMALASKLNGNSYNVYTIIGDGESQEGEIWEAAMASGHFHLDNLCAVLDHNKLQIDGPVKEIMNIEPVAEKWKAFGWETMEIDGHNIPQIIAALDAFDTVKGKPTMIIAHTVKGKGVSFMENVLGFHGRAPTQEETGKAMKELWQEAENLGIKKEWKDICQN
jgi:transketolase